MSYEFLDVVGDAARAAGFSFQNIYLKNPVDGTAGNVDIVFSEQALSRHIGNFEELLDQLNLTQKGLVKGPYEQKIIITS